jgi:dipeptidyl aminopeptidase/acylaminoacyl peptidase
MKELGPPWKPESRQLYEKMSPFNKIENVVTPTLILGGEKDWNVPIINSEQLYLALKIRGIPTELVVYPGEFHDIGTPSYNKDLMERYLAWFDRHID